MLKVKELCALKGITLAALASQIGISAPSLSSAINGNPTLEMLQRIAKALGVEVTELFDRKGTFTALVDNGGVLHRFDSVEALEGFISELKTSNQ